MSTSVGGQHSRAALDTTDDQNRGFSIVSTTSLWEVRRRHDDREDHLAEIARRTGRSILRHLTDVELQHLVGELRRRLPAGPVIEQDRWTLWRAERDPA